MGKKKIKNKNYPCLVVGVSFKTADNYQKNKVEGTKSKHIKMMKHNTHHLLTTLNSLKNKSKNIKDEKLREFKLQYPYVIIRVLKLSLFFFAFFYFVKGSQYPNP